MNYNKKIKMSNKIFVFSPLNYYIYVSLDGGNEEFFNKNLFF